MQVFIKKKDFPLVEYLFSLPGKYFLFRGFIIRCKNDLERAQKVLDLTPKEMERLEKMLLPKRSVVVVGAIYPAEVDILRRKVKIKENSIAYPFLRVFPYSENMELKLGKYLKSKVEALA